MPWYRTIKPEDELRILGIRSKLSYAAILDQSVVCPNGYSTTKELAGKCPNSFTRLSAFHYIHPDAKQSIFTSFGGERNIGVMLKRYQTPRTVIWRNSNRTEVSDYIFKTPLSGEEFEAALYRKNFEGTTEDKVAEDVVARFNKLQNQYKKEGLDINDVSLPWTEGLFRYQMNEIDGVVVNPKNAESCAKGYLFAKVIEKFTGNQCPFYRLTSGGDVAHVAIETVGKAVIKIDKKVLQDTYKQYCKAYREGGSVEK